MRERLRPLPILAKDKMRQYIAEAIQRCELYQAVHSGEQVYFELGTIDSPVILDELILVLQDSVSASNLFVRKYGDFLRINLNIVAIRGDFNDALGIPGAEYDSTNKHGKISKIKWMEWLLKSPPYIQRFNVLFRSTSSSRTGGAIMVEGMGDWELVEFAGTLDDNFVTRAMSDYKISEKMQRYIYRKCNELMR